MRGIFVHVSLFLGSLVRWWNFIVDLVPFVNCSKLLICWFCQLSSMFLNSVFPKTTICHYYPKSTFSALLILTAMRSFWIGNQLGPTPRRNIFRTAQTRFDVRNYETLGKLRTIHTQEKDSFFCPDRYPNFWYPSIYYIRYLLIYFPYLNWHPKHSNYFFIKVKTVVRYNTV